MFAKNVVYTEPAGVGHFAFIPVGKAPQTIVSSKMFHSIPVMLQN